jgi:hypothetical protein
VRNRRIGGTGFRVNSSEEEEDEMEAMAVGGAADVMVVADRALAMEVPAYRHPSTVMAALVGGHHGSRHDGARRDPLPLPRVAHLLVLAAGESPTMERRRKAYGELPCRGVTARG